MSATIVLRNVTVPARIGVYDVEKTAPQPLRLDLELKLSSPRASLSDRLRDTVDYDGLISRVREFALAQHFELLESLSYQLARTLLQEFPFAAVEIVAWKHIAIHHPTDIAVKVQMREIGRAHV